MLSENSTQILVVEDDEDIRQTMKLALELEGYQVHLAANGLEALKYKDIAPNLRLILLDLMMPEMDGRAFLKTIHEQQLFVGVPVIVLTAAGEKVKPEGSVKLVQKPLDLDFLYSLVKNHAQVPTN